MGNIQKKGEHIGRKQGNEECECRVEVQRERSGSVSLGKEKSIRKDSTEEYVKLWKILNYGIRRERERSYSKTGKMRAGN